LSANWTISAFVEGIVGTVSGFGELAAGAVAAGEGDTFAAPLSGLVRELSMH
jgi:hypothetical protein